MKALLDTNVILDLLLKRHPFYDKARAINALAEQRKIAAMISSSAMTDIFYLAQKELKNIALVYKIMDSLAADYAVVPIFADTIKNALKMRWNDFEDAVQYMAASENGADFIITRNAADFDGAKIRCISPEDFLKTFTAEIQQKNSSKPSAVDLAGRA